MTTPVLRDEVHRSLFLAGQVRRWHTWPTIRQPNNAEHSWGLCVIFIQVFGLPRAEVLQWMLYHDCGEQWAGDMPFGGKASVPGLRSNLNEAEAQGREKNGAVLPLLTTQEYSRVKLCDHLEMWEFACMEHNLGNQYMLDPMEDVKRGINEMAHDPEDAQRVWDWISQREAQ